MTEANSVPETGPTPLPTPYDHKAAVTAPASRPPPPPHQPKTNLPALLKAAPSGADAFLSHLQRCLATPSGVDTLLLFVCYLSRFTGAALTRLSQTLLRRTARELAALVFTFPPKTAILFGTGAAGEKGAAPARTAAARLAALLGQRLASLGSLASETRTIARLWSLVKMYFWARRLTLQLFTSEKEEEEGEGTTTTTTSNKLAAAVDWAQLISCTMFQVLENGAYLSGRGVLGWTPAEQGRAYVMGSRWLGVYTGLELGRLLAGLVAKSGGEATRTEEEKLEVEGMWRSLAINMAWTPLTLHWASEKPFLNDLAVGAGGCIPGVLQMRKLWKDTA